MMKRNDGRASYFRVALSGLANCFRAHPPLFFGLMMVSALLCAIEVGELFAMQTLFDAVAAHASGRIDLMKVAAASTPMVAVLILGPLARTLEYLGQGYFWRRGSGYLMARTHGRVADIPLIAFEKGETFERMERARLGSEATPSASRTILQFAFHFLPYLVLTSALLVRIQPALILALVIIFASVALSQALRAGIVRRFVEESAILRQQMEALERAITAKECAKETRTLGAGGYFSRLLNGAIIRFNRAYLRAEGKIARVELLLRLLHTLGYAAILAMLIYYLVRGEVSVGAFAAVFYSVERMSGVLKTMVDQFGEALEELSAAAFTHAFLNDRVEEGSAGFLDKKRPIHLESVSFFYPGRGVPAVRDVTITIHPGETLAIVGENGAGKSTIANLIVGLYRPTSGSVHIGGFEISDFAPKSRYHQVSSVFQNFVRYQMSLRDNIEISEPGRNGAQAAQVAGVNPDMETMLSREFGGVELSGGQWQRVAIARGLHRAHHMIALDEPTASIDPVEESRLFQMFRDASQGKTAILVTHRLGSARIADRILLLNDGQILELGTHEELMALNGKYASMYREQASWYER